MEDRVPQAGLVVECDRGVSGEVPVYPRNNVLKEKERVKLYLVMLNN